jgi:adenosylcobinamide-GDP ribazoletransferase
MLPPVLLILPPVVGRWAMVIAVYAFPYARAKGLGGYFRDGLGLPQVITATGIVLVGIALAARQFVPVVMTMVIGSLTVVFVGRWAAGRLGCGLTGDVYGALCELTELLCLLGLSLWASG